MDTNKLAISLGAPSRQMLEALCTRHKVVPELFLQAIIEGFLPDALDDRSVAKVAADAAHELKGDGQEDGTNGSMVLVLHVPANPARFVRAACELDGQTPEEYLYEALSATVLGSLCQGGRDREQAIENIFAAAALGGEVAP